MSPEHALLLCCARVDMTPADQTRLTRLVADDVDWDTLVQLGRRHGLLSFLYWHLKGLPMEVVEAVPADVLVQSDVVVRGQPTV